MKECDYRSVALASNRSFVVVRPALTYVYRFNVLADSVSTDQQEKKERRQTGPRAGRIMTQRLPTRFDYQERTTRDSFAVVRWNLYACVLVQRSIRFCDYRLARERNREDGQGLGPGIS